MRGSAARPSRVKVSLGRGECRRKGKLERILGRRASWGRAWNMVGAQERLWLHLTKTGEVFYFFGFAI